MPRIAIVGRPNVGKSSLLNMIARDKVSIVDPTAGTTRDRVSIVTDLAHPDAGPEGIAGGKAVPPIPVEVTDTGGYGAYVEDGRRFDDIGSDLTELTDDIEDQISQAVAGADLILFVIDAQAGITAADQRVAKLLREHILGRGRGPGAKGRGKKESTHAGTSVPPVTAAAREIPIVIVANKTDGPRWEAHALEAAGMGFGEPICVSAKNNYFRRDFLDALYRHVCVLPAAKAAHREESPEMKIAIIGKRNAGKSSLVNALAGEKRVIVSQIPGTTRDAVDVRIHLKGTGDTPDREFMVIDTAGLRKKKSFADRIEWWAFDRAQRSIERADVVFLLVDATEPLSQVDQALMKLVQKSFKPVVVVINKWDLVAGLPVKGMQARKGKGKASGGGKVPVSPEHYEEYLRRETKGLDFAPLAFISAATGQNIPSLINLAFDLFEQSQMRAPTGRLNRLLRHILETRGPSSKLGTFAKAYFISQVAVRPPTIVLVVNRPELFTPNYQRFLLNRLRDELPYPEVPIKLIIKERKRARIEDLLSGEHQRLKAAGAAVVDENLEAEIEEAERDLKTPTQRGEFEPIDEIAGEAAGIDDVGDEAEEYFED